MNSSVSPSCHFAMHCQGLPLPGQHAWHISMVGNKKTALSKLSYYCWLAGYPASFGLPIMHPLHAKCTHSMIDSLLLSLHPCLPACLPPSLPSLPSLTPSLSPSLSPSLPPSIPPSLATVWLLRNLSLDDKLWWQKCCFCISSPSLAVGNKDLTRLPSKQQLRWLRATKLLAFRESTIRI